MKKSAKRAEAIMRTQSFITYEQDKENCIFPWQYWEAASLSNEDRYELDKEAYKKTFWDTAHYHDAKFDETALLEILINKLTPAIHPVFTEYRKYLEDKIKLLKETENNTYPHKLTAPVIALFCSLINDAKIVKREPDERSEDYCRKICNLYNLHYSDRVRQNFNKSDTKSNINKIKELILPQIDNNTSNLINKYLDSKNLSKRNLYG